MRFTDYVKKLVAANPDIKPNHGFPVNRRELLAQGYIAAQAMAFGPGLLSILEREAYGQDCSTAAANARTFVPLITYDAVGGMSLGSNFRVGGIGGQDDVLPPGSYARIGLRPTFEPGQANYTEISFGGAKWWGSSQVAAGLTDATTGVTAAAAAKTAVVAVCAQSSDDTQNNPHHINYFLNFAGANGLLTDSAGTNESMSGANSMSGGPIDAAKAPVQVRDINQLLGIVTPGVLADAFGQDGIKKFLQAAQKMSPEELKRFQGRSVPEQIQTLINCGIAGVQDQMSKFTPASLDPRLDTTLASAFPNLANDGMQQLYASHAKLALDGLTYACQISRGGYDYHGQGETAKRDADREVGDFVAFMINAAAAKGKPVMIRVVTDGATSAGTTIDDTNFPYAFFQANDSGQRSMQLLFMYHPTKTTAQILKDATKVQAGGFNNDGAVATSGSPLVDLIGNSVPNAALFCVLQWMAVNNMLGDFEKVAGASNPFQANLDSHVFFNAV